MNRWCWRNSSHCGNQNLYERYGKKGILWKCGFVMTSAHTTFMATEYSTSIMHCGKLVVMPQPLSDDQYPVALRLQTEHSSKLKLTQTRQRTWGTSTAQTNYSAILQGRLNALVPLIPLVHVLSSISKAKTVTAISNTCFRSQAIH